MFFFLIFGKFNVKIIFPISIYYIKYPLEKGYWSRTLSILHIDFMKMEVSDVEKLCSRNLIKADPVLVKRENIITRFCLIL